MSPMLSMALVLVGVLCCPMAASGTERLAAGAHTYGQPSRQFSTVVLPTKGPEVDLSRMPLPLDVGPVTIGAFHVFPGREPGPHLGPPTRIWGLGFGTSLWRDPVTGWPET